MTGRFIKPPNMATIRPWIGMATRDQRLYLLYSIACQPNPDRARAERLLFKQALQTIANGYVQRPLGRYPHDGRAGKCEQCAHGLYMYEDCGQCVEQYARNVLAVAARRSDKTPASAMSTGTAKTPKAVEGRSPASAAPKGGDAQ